MSAVTYTITEGQLVRLCDGVPEDAVDLEFAFEFRDVAVMTLNAVQTGAPPVVGYARDSDAKRGFDHGWDAMASRIFVRIPEPVRNAITMTDDSEVAS